MEQHVVVQLPSVSQLPESELEPRPSPPAMSTADGAADHAAALAEEEAAAGVEPQSPGATPGSGKKKKRKKNKAKKKRQSKPETSAPPAADGSSDDPAASLGLEGSAEEDAAAARLQAAQRGRQGRRRVQEMQAAQPGMDGGVRHGLESMAMAAPPATPTRDPRVEQLFRQADADLDGYLDADEVSQLLLKLRASATKSAEDEGWADPSREEVEAAMSDMDADRSGAVSMEEFREWFRRKGGWEYASSPALWDQDARDAGATDAAPAAPLTENADDDVARMFRAQDSSGDGVLDRDEVAVLLATLRSKAIGAAEVESWTEPTPEEVAAAMSAMDDDGDGHVTLGEFRLWWEGKGGWEYAEDPGLWDIDGPGGEPATFGQRLDAAAQERQAWQPPREPEPEPEPLQALVLEPSDDVAVTQAQRIVLLEAQAEGVERQTAKLRAQAGKQGLVVVGEGSVGAGKPRGSDKGLMDALDDGVFTEAEALDRRLSSLEERLESTSSLLQASQKEFRQSAAIIAEKAAESRSCTLQ
eukprot:COSAG04_NODE_354_length_16062_cov_4.394349_4_plen_529_part_00